MAWRPRPAVIPRPTGRIGHHSRRALAGGRVITASENGMTLVEMAVVLVIVAILAVIVSSASGLLQQALLAGGTKGASDQVASAIRQTRQRAITNALDHCIQFSQSTSTYQIFAGGARAGTACNGGTGIPEEPNPVTLIQGATLGANRAFQFTPVSTVDPSTGANDITITTTNASGSCSVTLTVTAGGGVQLPGTNC